MLFLAAGWALTVSAQEAPPAIPEEDLLPVPTLNYDRLPPRVSTEFGVVVSYGTITYWRDQVPPWVGFGFRGGWGKHVGATGAQRLGITGALTAEGPVGVHSTFATDLHGTWDYVSPGQLMVGAGLGPAFLAHSRSDTVGGEWAFGVAPSAAIRLGWSQTYTRVGRRVFIVLEPKLRYVADALNPLVGLTIGSGKGR